MSTDGSDTAFLGLGANLGDATETLSAAVYALDDLDEFEVVDTSSIYLTPPWPPEDDPRHVPQPDYRNLVVCGRTTLEPGELLAEVQLIEKAFGRDRETEQRWGPRPLDIDLLLFGNRVVDTDDLVIPHPRLAERAFVLVPLLEVHPGGRLPDGRSLAQVLATLGGFDDITFDVRSDDLPSRRTARPEGPIAPAPTFARPAIDDEASRHGKLG